jgi:hypothetical protein
MEFLEQMTSFFWRAGKFKFIPPITLSALGPTIVIAAIAHGDYSTRIDPTDAIFIVHIVDVGSLSSQVQVVLSSSSIPLWWE